MLSCHASGIVRCLLCDTGLDDTCWLICNGNFCVSVCSSCSSLSVDDTFMLSGEAGKGWSSAGNSFYIKGKVLSACRFVSQLFKMLQRNAKKTGFFRALNPS